MEDPALLVMAVTEGWAGPFRRPVKARPIDLPRKTKRAAFSGRHVAVILCASCRVSTGPGTRKAHGKAVSRFLNSGRCGRVTRTLARESLRIVAFKLSGTTSRAAVLILYWSCVRRKRPGAQNSARRGLRDSACRGFAN